MLPLLLTMCVMCVPCLLYIYTTYVSNNEIIRRKYNIYLLLPNIKIPILLAIGHTIDSIFTFAKNKEDRRPKQPAPPERQMSQILTREHTIILQPILNYLYN